MSWQIGGIVRTTSRLRVAALATLASASFLVTVAAAPPPAAADTPPPATTPAPTTATPTTPPPATTPAPTTAPPPAPSKPAAAAPTLAERVIADAMRHLGDPYVWGASGPSTFDCSGLVYRVFADNGLAALIHDSHSAYEQYAIYRARGLASRSGGEPGDLVVYGGGSHIGIYLGNGRVISALVQGVRITGVYALTTPFTAFLHTDLSGRTVSLASTRRPTAGTLTRYTRASVSLRASATTTSARLAVLPPGTRLTVIRSTRDRLGRTWDDVRVGTGRVGWVANWLVRA
jgi:cell wall-associated NlpC family hydrolase